jgi:hypothetical protein
MVVPAIDIVVMTIIVVLALAWWVSNIRKDLPPIPPDDRPAFVVGAVMGGLGFIAVIALIWHFYAWWAALISANAFWAWSWWAERSEQV